MRWRFLFIKKDCQIFWATISITIHVALLGLLVQNLLHEHKKPFFHHKIFLVAQLKQLSVNPSQNLEKEPMLTAQQNPASSKHLPKQKPKIVKTPTVNAEIVASNNESVKEQQTSLQNNDLPEAAPVMVDATEQNKSIRLYPEPLNSHEVKVAYPEAARQLMIEGVVHVRLTVSRAGKVVHAEVISGAFALRNAALKAARKLFFLPATDELGQARVEQVDHEVVFKINRRS